jgi:hypothetical protein
VRAQQPEPARQLRRRQPRGNSNSANGFPRVSSTIRSRTRSSPGGRSLAYRIGLVMATLGASRGYFQDQAAAASARMVTAVEALAVLASPAVLYRLLRLRGMGPPQLPDPSIHSAFIFDPHDMLARYQALFTPTARLREAARVGFLVPARVSYLLFGAVPGFFVLRYVLALIAIVPVYLLVRRIYGRWAGFIGIAVVMSSPVVITAWGTDFPDSAAVSYLTGGLAALAMSWEARRWQQGWLAVAAVMLTLSIWTIGVSVPLVVVMVVVYVGLRIAREREHLARDLALLAASGVAVTTLLAICSKLLIGQLNFITPTVRSAQYLSAPAQERLWHSTNWKWAVYDDYLLLPPAVVLGFAVVFARRWRAIGTTQLFVGVTGAVQVATLAFLQFGGSVQVLEIHYFSSTLWSSINVMLAFIVVEVTRSIPRLAPEPRCRSVGGRPTTGKARLARWSAAAVPAALVVGVVLAYEAHPYVLTMSWGTGAAFLAATVVVGAAVGRLAISASESAGGRPRRPRVALGGVLAAGAVVVMVGASLILTVALPTPHGRLADTATDPFPPYSTVLGGNEAPWVDEYVVDSQIPGFVGRATYRGESMLTWEEPSQWVALQGPMGIYHNAATWVSTTFPVLNDDGARKIEAWHAAQVLLMGRTPDHFAQAVQSLARFKPVVVRRRVLSHGTYHLYVWLIDLRRYLRSTRA